MVGEIDYLQFEPRLNDFGDNYHKPDELVFSNVSTAVRKIRRKYRRYNDYVAAMFIIEEYIGDLIEKYGGKKNFYMALQLGTIREFIPPVPKFRKTEINKLQEDAKCVISEQDETKMNFELDEETQEAVDNASQTCGSGFDVGKDKLPYTPFDIKGTDLKQMSEEETIAEELDLLQRYSESEEYKASQKGKKKKKSSHNLLKEAKRRKKALMKAQKPRDVGDIIDHYNGVCNGTINEDEESFRVYKGVIVPADDLNNIQVMKSMQSAGFVRSTAAAPINSKKLRKMIREEEKASKKKKKKKNGEISQEDMDEFLDNYNESDSFGTSFKAFEKEMLAFDSSSMMRGIDD